MSRRRVHTRVFPPPRVKLRRTRALVYDLRLFYILRAKYERANWFFVGMTCCRGCVCVRGLGFFEVGAGGCKFLIGNWFLRWIEVSYLGSIFG